MKLIQVYDPAMCCSTGVCGPEVDPALVTFAADLKWLQDQGVEVQRFGLAQNPAAFVQNEKVRDALTNTGESALPIVILGDVVIASGHYPKRDELVAATGVTPVAPSLFTPAVAELVAIGAAIASNCEPCLRFHVKEAEKLGITKAIVNAAIAVAAKVKDAPHRNVMRLATRLTGEATPPSSAEVSRTSDAPARNSCCSPQEPHG